MGISNSSREWDVQVMSRRLVKASDNSIKPHCIPVSNLDLIARIIQISMFCIYPKPEIGNFDAVITSFEAGLPSFLNYLFPLTGRIVTNPCSGLPELRCNNQGTELVVGRADVALGSLDYGTSSTSSQRIQLPYGDDMALSVQVVSFACGGFTVAWRTNHVIVDGYALSSIVTAWSEFARSGWKKVAAANFDRSVFRARSPPSYAATLDEAFSPLDPSHQVNVPTTNRSFVHRLYHIEGSDIIRLRVAASQGDEKRATRVQAVSAYLWKTLAGVVDTDDTHCRMGWWVNGRWRLADSKLRDYMGNLIAFTDREAITGEVIRLPLPEVAAMVRDTIAAPAYGQLFQEMVDWMEERKSKRYGISAAMGLGSPTMIVTPFTSFRLDTDFGFGNAAMAVPTSERTVRLCSGYVQIMEKPSTDGSWIVSAFVWPQLAAALECQEPRIFKPLTAGHLGLLGRPHVLRPRL